MHRNLLTLAGSSLALTFLSSALALGQEPPKLWPDQEAIEHFLEEADITHREKIGTGITNPEKMTLELDGVLRYGAFKKVDKNHDSWKSEVAAYELDKLLGLGMVPPTVKRGIRGRKGSLQLWVEGMSMNKFDGTMRDVGVWRDQVSVMWLFDDLIANIDRHLNNAIVSPDERLILIDNSKTFRYQKTLLNDLNGAGTGTHARFWCVEYDADRERYPTRYPPGLIERLRAVTKDEIKDAIGKYVWGQNRDQVFDRLELILKRIDSMGAEAFRRGTGRYNFPPGRSGR